MNILQVANKALNPPDGGSLAIMGLTKGYLRNNHRVYLLNIETHKHTNNPIPDKLKQNENFRIKGVKVNTKLNLISAILNFIFFKQPYIAQRFVSKKFKTIFLETIQKEPFDVIQFEGLYSLQYVNYIPKIFKGKVLYRPHNLEHQIWKKNAKETSCLLKRIYFNNLSKRIKKLESKLLNRYTMLVPISQVDLDFYTKLGNKKPAFVASFGITDLNYSIDEKVNINQSLCYIGALDWIPNQNGIVWFVDKVLPTILKKQPEIKFYIAGRNAPNWFINKLKHKNIIYCGQVESAEDFLKSHGPFIVPLFSGSGMRVKLIEGMALKKAIVATELAAEGISVTHNKDILICNDENSFAENTLKLIENHKLQKEIGENAFKLVVESYNNTNIVANLVQFIKSN